MLATNFTIPLATGDQTKHKSRSLEHQHLNNYRDSLWIMCYKNPDIPWTQAFLHVLSLSPNMSLQLQLEKRIHSVIGEWASTVKKRSNKNGEYECWVYRWQLQYSFKFSTWNPCPLGSSVLSISGLSPSLLNSVPSLNPASHSSSQIFASNMKTSVCHIISSRNLQLRAQKPTSRRWKVTHYVWMNEDLHPFSWWLFNFTFASHMLKSCAVHQHFVSVCDLYQELSMVERWADCLRAEHRETNRSVNGVQGNRSCHSQRQWWLVSAPCWGLGTLDDKPCGLTSYSHFPLD
jgi:hypothetical protein